MSNWEPVGPLPPTPPPAPPAPNAWERFRTAYDAAPVTVSVVVITVLVWVVHEALITFAHVNTDVTLQDNGSAIHGQVWRLVTPLVVHYQIGGLPSVVHLGFNMLALWRIGPPVEQVIGRWRFAVGYLASGAVGQVVSDLYYQAHPLMQDGQTVQVVSGGASGAVFGVIGMLIGNYIVTAQAEKHGRTSIQAWRFNPTAAKSLGIQGVVWIVATSALFPGIDNWAHIGGALCGLVVGGAVAWSNTRAGTPSPPLG